MRSNPRTGFIVSLLISCGAGAWLLALPLAGDALYRALGTGMHPITLLAIFAGLCGVLVAMLFRRFMTIKSELVAGRDVLARWQVDEAEWRTFAKPAEAMARGEKLALLAVMWGFVVVICGGLALAVPRDAQIFGWIGLGIAALVTAGFLLGTRVDRAHLAYEDGLVVVGRRGMQVNRVLHVWSAPLTWLVGASVDGGRHAMLTVDYVIWVRFGPQYVAVRAPVPPDVADLANDAANALNAIAGRPGGVQRPIHTPSRSET